jgi:hypothetical protein
MNKFIVKVARSAMPSCCKGGCNYYRIAVIETDGINIPKQIHPKHKKVISIRYLRNRLYRGKTNKSIFYRCLEDANAIAYELNKVRA